jgi:hypothetical protein
VFQNIVAPKDRKAHSQQFQAELMSLMHEYGFCNLKGYLRGNNKRGMVSAYKETHVEQLTKMRRQDVRKCPENDTRVYHSDMVLSQNETLSRYRRR